MAEVVLKIVINKLDVLVTEEILLLSGVSEGVNDVKNELGRMLELLRVADANELEKKRWVKEMREVAFQSEDVLELFLLKMAYSGGSGLSAFPKRVIFYVKNVVARYNIGTTIQSIRSKIEKIHTRNQVYSPSDASKAVVMTPSSQYGQEDHSLQQIGLLEKEAALVGIEERKKKLIELIVSHGPALKVVSVVGMGGLGKSTLVRKVYDDLGGQKQFIRHAWITVSPKEHNFDHLLKDLIKQICKESLKPEPQKLENLSSLEIMVEVKKMLEETGYLIVLDNVWSLDAWEGIRHAFPDNKWGRLVITTRETDVAITASKYQNQLYHLQHLSDEESWNLFCARSFLDGRCPEDLEEISKKILKKCAGMPLAIATIGSAIFIMQNPAIGDLEKINADLGAELDDNKYLKSTYKILSFSYHILPDHLKTCLLYMSMFPEDYLIEWPRLIRLWVSERLVKKHSVSSLEQIAETYFTALINGNLIQVAERASDGRVRTCRIHNLLRNIFVAKSKDQSFAATVKTDGQLPDDARRISLHDSLFRIGRNQLLHQLRSLLLFEARESVPKSSMPTLSCRVFRLLTVLDLQGASLREFPESIVKLVNLRYLSLRNTKVSMVPSTISMLQKLETFDLKHTQVSELPAGIINLVRLRNLLLYHYKLEATAAAHSKHGFQAPEGIGDLKSLQKLCFVKAGIEDKALVKRLGELSELRRLGIIELSKENDRALCSSIAKLNKLQALSITLSSTDDHLKLKVLSNIPDALQRLYLTGKLKALPDWMKSLKNLVKIFLKSSKLRESPLEAFEDLPELVHIELLQVYTGSSLCFKKSKFLKLKILGLREFNSLETVTLEEKTMPNLERFTIERCERMKAVPMGIQYLTKLKVLDFVNMPRELITTMHPHRDETPDYWKVKHIQVVNFTYELVDRLWTETLGDNTLSKNDQPQSSQKINNSVDSPAVVEYAKLASDSGSNGEG